jgi:hypothetical protein
MADTRNRPNNPSREEQDREKSGSTTDPSRREGQSGRPQQERETTERSGTTERERSGTGSGSQNRPEGDVEGVGNR